MPVIIDVGANIGVSSIWFRSVYTDACIVAIEPDPGNVEVLNRNVGACPLITVVEAAVGSKAGFVRLVPNEKSWAVQTELADKGCPIVTIDQAVDMIPNGIPLLTKIDIEGLRMTCSPKIWNGSVECSRFLWSLMTGYFRESKAAVIFRGLWGQVILRYF